MSKAKTLTLISFLLFVQASLALGATRTWLPTTGGAWTTAANWSGGVAPPVAGDDIIISSNQSANITAVPAITLNSLTVSGNCLLAAATSGNTLTITNTLSVASGVTLTLGVTGSRIVFTLNGTGTIDGNLAYDAGTTVRNFTVNGTLIVNPSGRVYDPVLSAGSVFILSSGATLKTGRTGGISTGTAADATVAVNFGGSYAYSTGAKYEYIGTAAQVTGSGLTQNTPANVTINNAAGVTLSAATTISGSLIMTAGSLNLAANNMTAGDLQGSAAITKTSGAGTVTLTVGSNNASTTYSGAISDATGTIAVTKTGTGALTLSGNSSHSGTTTLSAGTLNINSATAIGSGPLTITGGTINNTSAGAITLSNNNAQNWNGDFAFTGTQNLNLGTGAVAMSANRQVTVNGGNLTVGGVITGAGFRLTKAGAGTLTLSGTNTFTGGTTLSAGTLNINNAQALGTVAGTFIINGGTLDNTTGGAITTLNYPQTWGGDFAFTGTQNLNLGTGAVAMSANRQVTVNANTLTVGGTITGGFNLTKAGAGTLSFGSNAVTVNSLSVNAGTLTSTSGTMNVAGTFTNNGAFNHNNGTVILNGSVAQSIGGSAAPSFNNLTLSNPAGAGLGNNATVNGVMALGANVLSTGTNVLTIGSAGSITRTTGYIYGNLQKPIPSGTPSVIFEIGSATAYLPASLAFGGVSSAGAFTIGSFNGDHPSLATSSIDPAKSVNRYWTVTNNGVVFTNYSMTLNFAAGEVDGGATTSTFTVGNYNAPTWTSPSVGTRTSTSTQATGVTTVGDFAIGNSNAYTITASAGANGSISPSGGVSVSPGGSQTFTIAPSGGYHVADVLVDGASVGAVTSYPFTGVAANHTISATFAIDVFSISASSGANGTVTPSGSTNVNYGGSQTYAITPATGYHVADVLVDGASVGAVTSYPFTNVTTNHTISATFAIDVFSITASSGANGAVTPAGSTNVNYGAGQSYAITPATGYHVADVLVDGASVGAVTSYPFTNVTANHTISASFAIDVFSISASSGANGTVTPAASTNVNYGGSQSYAITPATGYHVADVLVDGASVGAVTSYPFTNVTANHTISASFAIDEFTITASSGANGSVTPAGVTNVNYGAGQSYAITPATGYHVADVLVDGASVGAVISYPFTSVTANHTISASFAIDVFSIAASSGANGAVTPAGSTNVNYGAGQSYAITPATGYHVADVLVDGVSVGAVTSYPFTNVTVNHTISASFAIDVFSVSATSGANGTVSPAGLTNVNYGAGQSYAITPAIGYHVADVLVDGASVGAVTSYPFTSVSANHTISASFAIDVLSIAASSGANGTVTPAGSTNVNYGGSQTYAISPSTGYHVVDVLVDGASVGAVTSYPFTGVTANHTISASFAVNAFSITASAGANGVIAPSGVTGVSFGGSQSYAIAPNTGYHVVDVLVDGGSVGPVTSYPFTSVSANHTISASFAIDTFAITASSGANGAVTPAGVTAVLYGGGQTYTITPALGYHVADVLVDGASVGAVTSYPFTSVSADHAISASFAIDAFSITASAGANGVIAPSGVTGVSFGGSQTYTITPALGYHVADVLVDGASVGAVASYPFTSVTANHSISASFAIDTFTITASTGANGTVTPAGVTSVNYGAGQAYAIAPALGYHVADVLVDGVSIGAAGSHSFTGVIANHTISASFAIDVFTITASAGANGSIAPLGVTNVNYGGTQGYTITPAGGYHIADVLVDGASIGAVASHSFAGVTANHTISASFAIDAFTITASSGANGAVTPPGVTGASFGGSQSYAITPNTGYHVADVLVDGGSVGAVTSYPFTNITANHTISASFAIDEFTITASSGANGSVTPAGVTNVNYGGSQSYLVTPATGYHVADVLVDGASVGAVTSYPFTNVTANHTISATFAIDEFTITASSGANGSVSPSGATNVTYGGTQAYSITPSTGYHIADVLVDGVSVGAAASHTFTAVIANHTISASFAIDVFTITASSGANGAVTPAGVTNVNYGGSLTYAVTAATGYHVSAVLVDGVSIGVVASHPFVNVTANHTISATFAIDTLAVTASAGANGSIAPPGVSNVTYGGSLAYTMTPVAGYHVANVLVDGVSVGAVASYNFVSVTANHTISASFAINAYSITASAGTNGGISPTGSVSVNHGAAQSFTMSPNAGFHVADVLVDGVSVGAVTVYAFSNVTANHTIAASFAINTYTLTASSGPNGSIAPSGSVIVNQGSSQVFAFTPATGYHVDSVVVDGAYAGSPATYSFTNVTTDHSISVLFAINVYALNVSILGNGTVISSPNLLAYPHGQSVELTAVPDSEWLFEGWSGDLIGVVNPLGISMNGPRSVTATFRYDSVNQRKYRSFLADSIVLDRDNKGKVGKYAKRVATRIDFALNVVNDQAGATGFIMEFAKQIETSFPFTTTPPSVITPVDSRARKWSFAFAAPVNAGDTVSVFGLGSGGKPQKIVKYWWTSGGAQAGPVRKTANFTRNIPKLTNPNRVNAIFEAFSHGGFTATHGFVVGTARIDSVKQYAWLQHRSYSQVLKSLFVTKGAQVHTGPPRGFDFYTNGKAIFKGLKYLPPTKQNNSLIPEMIALRLGITASALNMTPIGFGELIYDDGGPNILNGMMVRSIAAYGDSLMSGHFNPATGAREFASAETFQNLATTARRINSAFEGRIDTISFATLLVMKGVRPLAAVPYLHANTSVAPVQIVRTDAEVLDVPEVYTLYQNYPNPFNPTTTIEFDLPMEARVTLKVYDLVGREVATLLDKEEFEQGGQEVDFDAARLSTGVYFYRIVAEPIRESGGASAPYTSVRKMVLLK